MITLPIFTSITYLRYTVRRAEKSSRIAVQQGTCQGHFSGKGGLWQEELLHRSPLQRGEGDEKRRFTQRDGQWSSSSHPRPVHQEGDRDIHCLKHEATRSHRANWDRISTRVPAPGATVAAPSNVEYGATSLAKSRIEVAQRELRSAKRSKAWSGKVRFSADQREKDKVFMRLATMLDLTQGNGFESDRTAGFGDFRCGEGKGHETRIISGKEAG